MFTTHRPEYPAPALRDRAYRRHRHRDAVQSGRGDVRRRAANIRDVHTQSTSTPSCVCVCGEGLSYFTYFKRTSGRLE